MRGIKIDFWLVEKVITSKFFIVEKKVKFDPYLTL